MEELEDLITKVYKGNKFHYAGLVEEVQSREGKINLRKITQSSRYIPVTWEGGILTFAVITEPSQVQRNRYLRMSIDIVVISEDPFDYEKLAASMPKYDFEVLTINFDSQSVYYKYMDSVDDKPFTGYARSISVKVDSKTLRPC
jgi:hypothetical protein